MKALRIMKSPQVPNWNTTWAIFAEMVPDEILSKFREDGSYHPFKKGNPSKLGPIWREKNEDSDGFKTVTPKRKKLRKVKILTKMKKKPYAE